MNPFSLALGGGLVLFAGYLVFRVRTLVRIRDRDRRFFYGFWIWPVLGFGLENAVPIWAVDRWLFRAAEVAVLSGLALDFFYYFALKAPTGNRHQRFSGLLILPFAAMVVAPYVIFRDPLVLAPPHYGDALVWTDRIWQPSSFAFIDTATGPARSGGARYQDPNYGRPVFSPFDGIVLGEAQGFLRLSSKESPSFRLEIGPFLPETVQVRPGDTVVAYQPLGLAAGGVSPPGIQLRVSGDRAVRFAECYAGRWLGFRFERALLKRNCRVRADARNRFRME